MKILLLDIEISPTIGVFWGLYNQHLTTANILGDSEVLCWSAKWAGNRKEHFFRSIKTHSKRAMLKKIYDLLEEADAVVTYNGNSFDLKILNKEFVMQGWGPPAPYKSIDLLATFRKRFRFTSNKLNYVADRLELGHKLKHHGLDLWMECMDKRNPKHESSWVIMERYNKKDVTLLEKLYDHVRGWIPNHPNFSLETESHCCPNCGSKSLQSRGFTTTAVARYRRFKCSSCGKWSRQRTQKEAVKGAKVVGVV